jgi:RoxA-like, cytochrome c-like
MRIRQDFLAAGLGLICFSLSVDVRAQDSSAVDRGKQNLFTRTYMRGMWSATAYHEAWRAWGLKEPPPDYDLAFRERYGLHLAPFDNGPYPMGLRKESVQSSRLAIDCLLCHAGSIFGRSVIGVPNTALDIQGLFEDLGKISGGADRTPMTMGHVRGTTEAGNLGVFLLSLRHSNLHMRFPPLDLKIRNALIGDAPAWWLLAKKQTMYHTGIASARSVRALMQFLLSPPASQDTLSEAEADFRDIREFILSLTPPKYPFPVDQERALQGERLFNDACATCHGTYGKQWTYPNKIIPIDKIGTDRSRHDGLSSEWVEHYNKTWFARERHGDDGYPMRSSAGYQAPPLDGIWATPPYFHNGSVPTVYGVLNSGVRPKVFTRTFGTREADYDPNALGWKVRDLAFDGSTQLDPFERRKIYDTTAPGRSNGGHTYGDRLTEEERRAVIEYLKTL